MKKRAQIWSTLIPWMIAIAVLLFSFTMYMLLKGKGDSVIDFFSNLIRFGR